MQDEEQQRHGMACCIWRAGLFLADKRLWARVRVSSERQRQSGLRLNGAAAREVCRGGGGASSQGDEAAQADPLRPSAPRAAQSAPSPASR